MGDSFYGSFVGNTEFYAEVRKGSVPKHSIVSKFGKGNNITALQSVTISGFYRTPIAATSLEAVSTDVDDTAAGAGAQEVTVIGLGADWAEVTQTVELDGQTPAAVRTHL